MSKLRFLAAIFIGIVIFPIIILAEETRILAIGPTGTLDFNDVNITELKVKTITLSNKGNAPLEIYKVRLHSRIKNHFSVNNWSGILQPSESVDINVTFVPNKEGLIQGLLYVDSNKTNSKNRSKLLRGVGVASLEVSRIIRVCEDSDINCSELHAEEHFGNVQIGTSKTQAVTIYNDGNTPLHVYNIYLHQKIRDMYSVEPWRGEIPPGGSKDILVTYTPNDVGLQKGRIYFQTDKTSGTKRKELVGTGVTEGTCSGALNIVGDGDYGLVPEGNNATKIFRLENLGNNQVTISSIKLHNSIKNIFKVKGDWTDVNISGRTSSSIDYVDLEIEYDSTKIEESISQGLVYVRSSSCTGTQRKLLRAESDSDNSYRILDFYGDGNFGAIDVGSSITKQFTIENKGNDTLTVNKIYVHPRLKDFYAIDESVSLPLSVAPYSTYTFNVTYTPLSAETNQGLIYVKSNRTNMDEGGTTLLVGSGK